MADTENNEIPAHGVPDGATEAEPTGLPTSDRHHSETSASEKGGNAQAPKHEHGATKAM